MLNGNTSIQNFIRLFPSVTFETFKIPSTSRRSRASTLQRAQRIMVLGWISNIFDRACHFFFRQRTVKRLCIARERWQEPKPLTSISINFAYQSVTFTIVFHVERYWVAIILIYFTRWRCEVKIRAKVHCKWINNPRWSCLRSIIYQRWSNDYEIH